MYLMSFAGAKRFAKCYEQTGVAFLIGNMYGKGWFKPTEEEARKFCTTHKHMYRIWRIENNTQTSIAFYLEGRLMSTTEGEISPFDVAVHNKFYKDLEPIAKQIRKEIKNGTFDESGFTDQSGA